MGTRSLSRRRPLSALTLVEMLVAMAITLVMMAAVVNLFASVGQSVRNRQATIELSGGLRMARLRLQQDLAGATCPTLPWQRQESNTGYLEIVEGLFSDKNPTGLTIGPGSLGPPPPDIDTETSLIPGSQLINPDSSIVTDCRGLGDYDDILALTVRSQGEPFIGHTSVWDSVADEWVSGPTIESTLAEVIWYAVENPANGSLGEPGLRTIHRRVLLIASWIDLSAISLPSNFPSMSVYERFKWFYDGYDISVRIENDSFVPNTLADLTKRENRFGHLGTPPYVGQFPWALDDRKIRHMPVMTGIDHPLVPLDGERQGEDVMLSGVLAFDVRVYDPGAQLVNNGGSVVEPSDAGWRYDIGMYPVVGFGAYVDLNYWWQYRAFAQSLGISPLPPVSHPKATLFSSVPAQKSLLDQITSPPPASDPQPYPSVAYDTWSFHYENDGLNQDMDFDESGFQMVDEGTNGLDDPDPTIGGDPKLVEPAQGDIAFLGVDDMGERETAPPYDVPLRGLRVKLRVYDRDSRNIRETSVTKNFVP